MSGTHAADPSGEAEARAAEEQERLAAERRGAQGENQDPPGGEGEHGGTPEEQEARRSRPGKLERRLARIERERDEARREAAAAAEARRDLERRLAEAHEAGHKLVVRNLTSDMASAQAKLREAIVSGDPDAIVEAQGDLSRLAAVQANLSQAPAPAPRPAPAAAPQSYTPTTSAWLAANPWYGKDEQLTSIARSAHAAAVRAGHEVDSPGYWRAVENGVEALVPGTVRKPGADPDDHEEDPPPPPRRPAGGAPPTRGAPRAPQPPQGGGADPKLTPEEADAAKISGMTPQEYKREQQRLIAAGRIGGDRR